MPGAPDELATESVTEIVRHPLRMRMLDVIGIERTTPRLVRVTLAGSDMEGFRSDGAADHVKLFVPVDGEREASVPILGPSGIEPSQTAGRRPTGRDYTPRHHLLGEGKLQLDVVLHEGGHAAAWAQRARLGDRVGVAGPRGSEVLRARPPRLVLVGDETALPAIHNFLLHAGADQRVDVVLDVASRQEVQPLASEAAVDATWLFRGDAPPEPNQLLAALAALARPDPDTYCWAAGEASGARAVRAFFLDEWHRPPAWISTRGYWKLGEPDHQESHRD